MNSLIFSIIVFACIFGCALIGFFVRRALPDHHLSSDTLLAVSLTTGLTATLSSLVLGMMISSTHASFIKTGDEVAMIAARTIMLDRVLVQYGAEAAASRSLLKALHQSSLDNLQAIQAGRVQDALGMTQRTGVETLQKSLRALTPANDYQRDLKKHAIEQAQQLAESRWLIVEQRDSSIPQVFYIALIAWLAFIFFGFGLLTENNTTVLASLLGGALVATSAIFLIIELDSPLSGAINVSSRAISNVSAVIGN